MRKNLSLFVTCLLVFMPDVCLLNVAGSMRVIHSEPALEVVSLIINEYQADPADGIEGDANGDGTRSASQDEFVELVNTDSAPLDVSGFTISDAAQVRFTFPQGKIIPVGEAAVVFGGGTPMGDFGNAGNNGLVFAASGLNLNNGADSIIVKDHFGVEVTRRDYPSADGSANQSITLSPDISGDYVRHSLAAGSNGALFSPGRKITGEAFTVAPLIANLSPASHAQSDAPFDIDLIGEHFQAGAVVRIDATPVATSFIDNTKLIATVPASVASTGGNHRVEVVNTDGNHSNALNLEIILPAPVLYSLAPRIIEIGAGQFTLFLQGLNFANTTVVLVDNVVVTTAFSNKRELRATIPAALTNALGERHVKVRNPDGKLSNELIFEITAKRPRITAINPQQVLVGSPAFTLEVTGANFNNQATISFNQTPLETKFISSTVLLAEVKAEFLTSAGLKPVAVTNPDGVMTPEIALRVIPDAPRILSLTPDSAIEGSATQTIEIIGEQFRSGAQVRMLTDSPVPVELATRFISDRQLEAILDADFLQTAKNLVLTVENPDFGISNEAVFKVLIKDPLVINEYLADPADSEAGDANGDGARSSSQDEFIEIVNRTNTAMDISGYKISDNDSARHVFEAGTVIPPFECTVVFGGGTANGNFGNALENRLVFKASTGGLSLNNGGDVIKLEDAQGHIIQEIHFTAIEGNANESINREPDGDGAVFSLHTMVGKNGKLFSPGTKATGDTFTIKPLVTELMPASIHVNSPAFTLKISGEKFSSQAQVLFNETLLATNVLSSTEIEAMVGAEFLTEAGFVNVQVRNPKGELSRALQFLIIGESPRIRSLTPAKTGTGAENLEIVIQGEHFQRASSVSLAGEKITTQFNSATALTVIAPAKFFTAAGELAIKITNADGRQSNEVNLSVENGPLITRLSPKKIKTGSGASLIKISGVAFQSNVVLFVNHRAVPTEFQNDAELRATIPAELTGVKGELELQARHTDGGRSNRVKIKVVE
ncbi:MAG: lamin tail domain-containing protein [Acidobacteriota bacterium]